MQPLTRVKFNNYEFILAAALALSPFDLLRFFGLRISDYLFLIFLSVFVFDYRLNISFVKGGLSKYYGLFVLFCIPGWIYNTLSGLSSGDTRTAINNLLAYSFTLMCMIAAETYASKSKKMSPKVVITIYFWLLSIIDCILYAYSRGHSTLLGYSLLCYGQFCPLGSNIHQLAMIATPLPFVGLSMIPRVEKKALKALYLLLSAADVYIVWQISTTKADMGIAVGLVVYGLAWFISHGETDSHRRNEILYALCSLSGVICSINSEYIFKYLQSFFYDNDNHHAREQLYRDGLAIFADHPLLGLGPANHIKRLGIYYDAHQTYLTAGLSAGIPGMISIAALMIQAFAMTLSNPLYASALVPIFIYSAGGDILRKMGVLVLIELIAYTSLDDRYYTEIVDYDDQP